MGESFNSLERRGAVAESCALLLFATALMTACGSGAQTSPVASPPPADAVVETEKTTASSEEESAVSEQSDHSSAPGEEKAVAPVEQAPEKDLGPENALRLCSQICDKVSESCSARASQFCRSSCSDYESAAEKCPLETEQALACQTQAEDFLLCSNIAAESCTPLYRRLDDCRQGKVAAQKRGASESAEGVPAGFELHQASAFTQLMPVSENEQGVSSFASKLPAAKLAAQSTSAEGNHYSLVSLPAVAQLSATRILKTATAHVGDSCQSSLRLNGQYESKGATHVRYEAKCADGSQLVGMLHFMPNETVVSTVSFAGGSEDPEGAQAQQGSQKEHLQTFLYGFELLEKPSP